jgi:hypothetical protein
MLTESRLVTFAATNQVVAVVSALTLHDIASIAASTATIFSAGVMIYLSRKGGKGVKKNG